MERLKTSDVSISNRNIKCPIGKSIFAVILPLKLFRVAVANVDIGNLKSLYTFLKNVCSLLHASEILTKSYVQSTRN